MVAIANPLADADQILANWFHAHLTPLFVTILRALSEPASNEWIAVTLFFGVLFFAWKRWWPSLATLIIAVPIGMLLNELIKVAVHRPRPFVEGAFVDWSGYSFASGHTIGATLLYGQILLFVIPVLKSRRWRGLAISAAAAIVISVGFSRIALGAHYLTDVLAGVFLGTLWLTICYFVLKPFRTPVPVEIIPNVIVTESAIPLAPGALPVAVTVPATELAQPSQLALAPN